MIPSCWCSLYSIVKCLLCCCCFLSYWGRNIFSYSNIILLSSFCKPRIFPFWNLYLFLSKSFFFSICTLYAVFITGISHIARTGYATVWGQLWNLIWRSPITPCFRNYRLTTLWLFWRWETLQFLISLIHNDLLAEV